MIVGTNSFLRFMVATSFGSSRVKEPTGVLWKDPCATKPSLLEEEQQDCGPLFGQALPLL